MSGALAIGFGFALVIAAVGLVAVWMTAPMPPMTDETPPPDLLRDLRNGGGL